MRFGGPVFYDGRDGAEYARAHVAKGYRAAYCPEWLKTEDDAKVKKCFAAALARYDVVLAEVGIWKNVLDPNPLKAKEALEWSVRCLALADELGAQCAVNTPGSWCPTNWDGPHPAHYGDDFFDAAVEAARKVIDAVKPKRSKMTFEVMPCMFLDSAAEYLRFLKAIDRPAAGIHLDPTNSITCPRRLYNNAAFFRDEFALYGTAICSIHIKDIHLAPDVFTVRLDEVVIGRGDIDYVNLFRLIEKLPPDTPVMLEHLATEAEYDEAAAAVRAFARKANVSLGLR